MYNLILLLPFLKGVYFFLHLLQLDKYQIFSSIQYLKTFYLKTHYIVCCYLLIFCLLENPILNIIIYVIIFLITLIPSKYVLKLKFTKRIIRLIITTTLLSLIPILVYPFQLTYILLVLLIPFIIILSNLINTPFELLINNHYKKVALKILKASKPYIIEITGSYGKTTLKNILYEIYNNTYLTLKTPASYNTPMGISKTISTSLNPLTELFIVEAGATKLNDIKTITKMIKPNLGIITQIGPQHLKTFKSMDNVLKTKWELPTYMSPSSKLVLNYESKYLEGLTAYNLNQTISCNTSGSDFEYRNVVVSNLITEFDIYKHNQKKVHIKTQMLGIHNIQNIVLAYAVKCILDEEGLYLSDEEFIKRIGNITNPLHRLSMSEETINHVTFRYLDDAYNSNLEGFLSAIKTLKTLEGIKVLITPGIVDMGDYEKTIIERLVMYLNGIDDLILIDNKNIKLLTSYLVNRSISYLIFDNLKEALSFIKDKYSSFSNTKINILLENDLPDNYLKR